MVTLQSQVNLFSREWECGTDSTRVSTTTSISIKIGAAGRICPNPPSPAHVSLFPSCKPKDKSYISCRSSATAQIFESDWKEEKKN